MQTLKIYTKKTLLNLGGKVHISNLSSQELSFFEILANKLFIEFIHVENNQRFELDGKTFHFLEQIVEKFVIEDIKKVIDGSISAQDFKIEWEISLALLDSALSFFSDNEKGAFAKKYFS